MTINIFLRLALSLVLLTPLFAPLFAKGSNISAVSVEQDSGLWELQWNSQHPVDIYVSGTPDLSEKVSLGTAVSATSLTVRVPESIVRPYFEISSPTHSVKAAERLLPLEGGRNFRDLGGYTTADGQTVRWGRLFRSGYMTGLTNADYDYLSAIGIKVVCDLRSKQERENEPTKWRANPGARYVSWDYESVSSGMEALFADGVPTPQQTHEFMRDGYADIVYDQSDRYAVIFDELAAGNIPLAFNCSAGKDRAGMAAALILTALGVERDQIVHDYSLSETFVDYMAAFAGPDIDKDSPYAFLAQLPPEVLSPMLRSDPEFINTAFKTIETDHGSVMNFIRTELKVSDEELAAIRGALLE